MGERNEKKEIVTATLQECTTHTYTLIAAVSAKYRPSA